MGYRSTERQTDGQTNRTDFKEPFNKDRGLKMLFLNSRIKVL